MTDVLVGDLAALGVVTILALALVGAVTICRLAYIGLTTSSPESK